MASEVEQKIIKQVEYYFGDINLLRDKFLQEKIKEDDGWVTLEVLLTFKKLAALSTDAEVVASAVEKSENKLVLVSEDRKKLRRNPEKPLPEMNDERKKGLMERTAYAKGFPLDENIDDILAFMEPYNVEHVNRRATKDHKFKGSCFIVFKDVGDCKKFIELESVKYKDTELIRKFQAIYMEEKKKEIEEKKQSKLNKKPAVKPEKTIEYPKAATIHFSGIKEGEKLTREELKEKIKEVGDLDVQFVDFNKGDVEGYVRFPEENNAVEFLKKLTDGELEVEGHKLKVKLLEGEEEETYLKKTSDLVLEIRKKQKGNSWNKKRKGNFNNKGGNKKVKKEEKV